MSEEEESASGSPPPQTRRKKNRNKKKKKLYEGARMTKRQYKAHMVKMRRKAQVARKRKILEEHAKSTSRFFIKCRKPVEDEIFDVDEYVKFLKERFKMNGKTGVVGAGRPVHITKNVTTVYVSSKQPYPKKYLKYLTKRYLKRHGLRDYVRIISDKKPSLELRYFNIQEDK